MATTVAGAPSAAVPTASHGVSTERNRAQRGEYQNLHFVLPLFYSCIQSQPQRASKLYSLFLVTHAEIAPHHF
jgi:hypothetical protein